MDSGSEPPAYLTAANLGNRISADWVSPNHGLLHLASLNALLRQVLLDKRYLTGDLELAIGDSIGRSLPAKIDAATVDLIAASVQSAGEGSVRRLAGLVSDALGPTEPHWWAAFACEVEKHLQGEDWTGATVLLGLGHLNAGDWLLAWRYSPLVAGKPSTGPPSWRPQITATTFRPLPAKTMGLPYRWPRGTP